MNDLVHNHDLTPEPATDAQNARGWRVFADQINGAWRKSAGDFIACSKFIAEAKEELSRDAYNAMVKSKLDFVPSVARKLVCIAANETLCSPGNKLPPAWTILYHLSQLPADTLKAALADGRVHPGMSRQDAIALRAPKQTTATMAAPAETAPLADSFELITVWQVASPEQRRALLDDIGPDGLCAAMSTTLMSDLRDRVIDVSLAGASKTAKFATYATNKFHCALHCAAQKEPDSRTAMAALGCIIKQADAKGVSHSDVVIAQGKPKGGWKK